MNQKATPKAVTKRLDTSLPQEVLRKSGVTRYWLDQRFRELWKAFRPGFSKVLPKGHDPFNQKQLTERFNLKGFEYGNWLSQEDRYNYFLACELALYDLDSLLGFRSQLGLDKHVGIAFGARGRSGALAHYEPATGMINLTRFKEAKKMVNPFSGLPIFGNKTTDQVKDRLFEKTGGVGSLGHEYAHALDYFFGTYIEQDTKHRKYRSLTQGDSVDRTPDIDYPTSSLRYDANMITHKLIWEKPGKHTPYFKLLLEAEKKYWVRHNELFARAFEVYLSEKLKEKRIKNAFLVKNKYEGKWPYMQGSLVKKIVPHFDSLIAKMRKKL
ncbi:LPD1 domain-containing protein [Sunxiuqinia elliptica]